MDLWNTQCKRMGENLAILVNRLAITHMHLLTIYDHVIHNSQVGNT